MAGGQGWNLKERGSASAVNTKGMRGSSQGELNDSEKPGGMHL